MTTPENPQYSFESARFCPRCGAEGLSRIAYNRFDCAACGFEHYTGTKCAVACFVTDDHGHLLLLRRTRDPGKGLWTMPGGFIDPGETAEAAAIRETREETQLEAREVHYFFSAPNDYTYQGLTAPVCDLFFEAVVPEIFLDESSDEVEEMRWFRLQDLPLDQIAFSSVRAALMEYRRRNSAGT